jgi:DNA/RNA endonuclease G (NUC1)
MNLRRVALAATAALLVASSAFAAIPISTSTPITQNFDTIGTASAATLPTDWKVDRTTTQVRTLGTYGAAGNVTTIAGGGGLSGTASNGIYNFGAGTNATGADRAIGFLSSGTSTASGTIYVQLANNTGGGLSGLQIAYNVEKYRTGSNPAGFRYQLFFSTDGTNWNSAGASFLTSLPPDGANAGYANAPGVTVPVSATLNTFIGNGSTLYLAWNYSVPTGITVTNSQGLGIDDVSILGIASGGSTNPSVTGAANPTSVAAGGNVLLTATVTPGANPTSTGITVTGDLASIGGSASQPFFDNGSNGDVTANDGVFSYRATVPNNAAGGSKTVLVTATDAEVRSGSAQIAFTVATSTPPSGTGTASPNAFLAPNSTLLTVTVTPGSNPTSTGIAVTGDLSSIGGSATTVFSSTDGTHFTFQASVASNITPGTKSLPVTITDLESRSGGASITLTIQSPPTPLDHLVISQVFGGGGNAGAAYTNDYVEIFNPTTTTWDVTGWSVQYASATGSSWQTQPIAGPINPGEYYLVRLATNANIGTPVSDYNIAGTINMSGTSGKVALVSAGDPLSGACATDASVVDWVGYGTADCSEGGAAAPVASAANGVFRKNGGFADSNVNSADFQALPASPRRTAVVISEFGPWVGTISPRSGNTPKDASITISFSEAVNVDNGWYTLSCVQSGAHSDASVYISSDFKSYVITPNINFMYGEQCSFTILRTAIHDQDTSDPNPATDDNLIGPNTWSFTVVAAGQDAPFPATIHLTMGSPTNAAADINQPNDFLMSKPTYALSYNKSKATANWVSWHLDQSWFGSLARVDTFRPDPAVPANWYRVQDLDYNFSGFDRGHMTPNADRDHENRIPINQETYLMSNIVPQAPDNNQGPWAALEGFLRTLANCNPSFPNDPCDEVFIVAGPQGVGGTGSNGAATSIGGGITVPANTWKVALVLPKNHLSPGDVDASTRTIAVIMPNVQGIRNNDWHTYLTTVNAVEQLTGYKFFSNVTNEAVRNAIKAGVDGANPPGAGDQSVSTPEDVQTTFTLKTATRGTGTPTLNIVTAPAHGMLSPAGLTETYTPSPDYFGDDTFQYTITDGTGTSNTATVKITISEVNDASVAAADTKSTNEDTPLTFNASDLTANDNAGPANESAQTLTVTAVSDATHGSATLNGLGQITYTPDADYNGSASFAYTVCDNGKTAGVADPKCATATVNVTVNAINDPPVVAAVADKTMTLGSTLTVQIAATDIDSSLTYTVAPASAGATIDANGLFKWTPAGTFAGTSTTFTVSVNDGTLTVPVSFAVAVVDDGAPVISALTLSTTELWPAQHQMLPVTVSYTATDAGDTAPVCTLRVLSNEPVDGLGDGDTAPDWTIVDAHHIQLRAERSGTGNGRVYSIYADCADRFGNTASSAAATVNVPKNKK